VSTARAAQILAISQRKLWELSNSGEIRHLRIGRGVRYDMADLAAWVEERKEGGGE
jgi:excisionase family DNA binding protein